MKQIDAKGQMSLSQDLGGGWGRGGEGGGGGGKGPPEAPKRLWEGNLCEALSRVVELLTPHKSPRLKAGR